MKVPPSIGARLYWFSQRLRGRGAVRERLEFLRETQEMSPTDLDELQALKLQALVRHAHETVPYYRQALDDRGIKPSDIAGPEDLRLLPRLDRATLGRHADDLVSSRADRSTLDRNFSSGSTGERAEFLQDADFRLWMRAHQLRTYEWCAGWRLGDPFVLLWGSEIYWSLKQWIDRIDNVLSNRREFNTFRLTNDLIDRFLRELVRFDPVLISTYSNAMHLIARAAERRGVHIPGLKAVQGTSEPLPPALRATVEQVFGCETYDKYGMRETNIVSHESPSHDGMLIQAENVVVEILRADGSPCAPGETGRVVVTPLNNLSMPLLRYETSDLAAPLDGLSTSGLPFRRMSSVAGREQDLIVTPDGDHIDSYFFSYLLMRFREIDWFQVVQRAPDELLLRLCCPAGISAETEVHVRQQITAKTGHPFRVDIELLEEMPRSPTGKFRLCVSALAGGSEAS